ncbi:N-acetylmuramoyl-L-alanine amidase family protein [Flavivirga jejuensis]|uniref:N-acetylmuramoyl-L-alanine amidase n=1 Tax=Flavivirga jejuensis TaxID=870487 RepID=A0ABT8WVF4_9FLAO|nr:N-acetylmuramoyl-L-alanine amidase [Flavivirga jejuensis]MDO5977163.1 N-acetylmuramoyl-L-alanine amidase [Flavivirga jejuensis]
MILALKMCVVFGQQKIIVIDLGHGGKDSGAIGINSIQEKDVVLNVAKEILKLNKMILNDKFEIYLTRYKDTLISLSDRSRLAKSLNADVFLSLHCNSSYSYSKGIEVYVHNSDKPNTKKSINLGLSILNESTQKLGFKKRGVKFANFQVLRGADSFFPAILLELGFVTNTDEADYFFKPKNIEAVSLAVFIGISNYLNVF